MIRIALCEDSDIQRGILLGMFEEYRSGKNLPIEIDEYSDGQELVSAYDNGKRYNIYFLDVVMPLLNGIDTARHLRDAGDQSQIIFLTAQRDYAVESYQVHAYYYLVKPVDLSALSPLLDRCIADMDPYTASISVNGAEGIHTLPVNEINYVSLNERRALYHLTDGSIIESTTLRTSFRACMEELLQINCFTLCGASLIINLSHVKDISWEEIAHFKNGDCLTLPHSAALVLKKALKD